MEFGIEFVAEMKTYTIKWIIKIELFWFINNYINLLTKFFYYILTIINNFAVNKNSSAEKLVSKVKVLFGSTWQESLFVSMHKQIWKKKNSIYFNVFWCPFHRALII